MQWREGRQGGYWVHTFFSSKRLHMDCHLIKYETGHGIPPHTDPVEEGRAHYRLNVVLKKPYGGGKFSCNGPTILNLFDGRIILFRPDLYEHSVSRVYSERLVFSLGWTKKIKV